VDYCQDLQHHRGSYVAQDDAAYASLTVRETLTLSALLRLPREMSRTEKIARVRAPQCVKHLPDDADSFVFDPGGKRHCRAGTAGRSRYPSGW
jgi:hypothetical protein